MKYAAMIEYSQDRVKVEAARPAHRAYLTNLVEKNQLFASGPFEDGYGALIIYEADSLEGVEALMKADPFHASGVFVRWTVRPWKMVFSNPALHAAGLTHLMSDVELAITRVKALEALLEQGLGATGKGLHEKVSNVQDRLAPELVKKLRFVATIRNKIVHEADYQRIDDRDGFVRACDEADEELKALLPRVINKGCLALVVLVTGASLAWRLV